MSGHHYFGQPWPLCKYPKKIGFKFRKSSLYHLYSSLGTNYYLCLSNASPLLGPVSQCTLDPYWAVGTAHVNAEGNCAPANTHEL